jgi:predicted RNase H-like HicB family nuclease
MIADYLEALLSQATYTTLPDGKCQGQIPGQDDLWAQAPTPDACRQELQAVLETWALGYLTSQEPLPAINGVHLLKDACAFCPFTPALVERSV